MPDRSARLVTREVLPFGLALLALAGLALAIDAGLHLADQVWIGRWLGIPGLVLILSSFAYSLRKRKITTRGKPVADTNAWRGWAHCSCSSMPGCISMPGSAGSRSSPCWSMSLRG
jgi:hypothetical protein